MADVKFIFGKRYSCDNCHNINDFIEMTYCNDCNGSFCLNCRNSFNHSCIQEEININYTESKLKKCPIKGCKDKLNLINRFQCNKCLITHCLYHHIYEAHNCPIFNKEQSNKENLIEKEKDKIKKVNNLMAKLKTEFIK